MKRFSNGDSNGEGFQFNEEEDDDDFYGSEIPIEVEMGPIGSGTSLIETHFRQKLLDKAAEIAKQDWFWNFRSVGTRIKMIEKIFKRLIKLVDRDQGCIIPNYNFKCNNCELQYEALTKIDETNKHKDVTCPKCASKKKTKLLSSCSFAFTNPVGTKKWTSERDGHGYRFHHNLPKALNERAVAETMSHMGADPYGGRNDLAMNEGVHDNDLPICL